MTNPHKLVNWVESHSTSEAIGTALAVEAVNADTVKISELTGGGTVFVTENSSFDPTDRFAPLVLVSDRDDEELPMGFIEVLPTDTTSARLIRAVRLGLELSQLRQAGKSNRDELGRTESEVLKLVEIGKHLSSVGDIDLLLDEILATARSLVSADAGSIYLLETENQDPSRFQLRFKLSQNDSLHCETQEYVLPLSPLSIAGAAATFKKAINIPDVRTIVQNAPYRYDSSWDEKTGYSTRSVLAVPMINQHGEVIGAVQLINKKRTPGALLKNPLDFEKEVLPLDAHDQELVETLASQAGIAMENTLLYNEIQTIFDGFIRASVHAIEQRDPTTSGHSFRVAALTKALAEVVSAATEGPFAEAHFDADEIVEIETAALLHDFGKVGVREEVLVKAKKLYPPNLKMVRARFDFIRRSIENDHLHRRLMMVEEGTPAEELAILDQACERAIGEIEDCWRIIRAANEPTVLEAGDFHKIEEIAKRSYFDLGGQRLPFLEKEEVTALQVAKGTLTADELQEIRSHAAHSISFLQTIPWSKKLRRIPDYAGAHHEKLDGSGYPYGLTGESIPLPAKMMAVADIFDALTAADRPYKKAVPVERALYILELEAKDNHIDPHLVRLFAQHKVYKILEQG